jgi:hypothetical protein
MLPTAESGRLVGNNGTTSAGSSKWSNILEKKIVRKIEAVSGIVSGDMSMTLSTDILKLL